MELEGQTRKTCQRATEKTTTAGSEERRKAGRHRKGENTDRATVRKDDEKKMCVSLCSTSGEGRLSESWSLRGFASSLSPRMERSCLAIMVCCSTEQWFSRERIRGYGEAWRIHTAAEERKAMHTDSK